MSSILRFGVTVALSATGILAHPLSRAQLLQRADELLPEYDYVVVGAGASGLTVANRLSENENVKVLVIEAGDFDKSEDYMTIPGLAGGAIATKYDWNTSYTAGEGLNGRIVSIPQGRVVGGSTKLNRMVFDRGSKSDYDGWEALGNEGWNFDALLPYLKKNENFTGPTAEIQAEYGIQVNPEFHGNEGYMQTTYSPFFWPTTKNIVQATKELGIPVNDQATGNAFGGYFCPHNQDTETLTRSSAEEAYYDSAEQRPNFHLLSGHQVSRIITDRSNGTIKVTGLEFAASADAERQTVKVGQEAILAAGALHSPQLLQVSGIGDASLLKSINVTSVVHLPAVGHNLHDHISVSVVHTLNTTMLTNTLTTNDTFAAQARQQYDTDKTGPLTSATGDFLLFLPVSTYTNATFSQTNSSISLPADTPPEVAKGYASTLTALTAKMTENHSAFLEVIWADGVMVLGLQHPFSRGQVTVNSSCMFSPPVADVAFLRNEMDVALLREGVHFARSHLATAPSIASLNPLEVSPGANVTSDADIDSFIRGSASTLYHPAGTCKMGPRDEGGVVDTDLKVYGVEGLRVVDASVMPILPASHVMTTVYAVAERAADLVKRGRGL